MLWKEGKQDTVDRESHRGVGGVSGGWGAESPPEGASLKFQ